MAETDNYKSIIRRTLRRSKKLAALSPRVETVETTREEMLQLWSLYAVSTGITVVKPDAKTLAGLRRRLDRALKGFDGGAYCKLGLSGPKPCAAGGTIHLRADTTCTEDVRVSNARDAIDLVLGDTDCAEHLHFGVHEEVDLPFRVREWADFQQWQELRLVVFNGELSGISQRNIGESYAELLNSKTFVQDIVAEWCCRDFLPAIRMKDIIADVVVWPDENRVLLLDLNPMLAESDVGLFDLCRDRFEELEFRTVDTTVPLADSPV